MGRVLWFSLSRTSNLIWIILQGQGHNLCVIDASEGKLEYEIEHPVTKMFVTVYRETYEEAVARLADPSLPLVPFQPDPEISQEQLIQLRKGISFVSDDGAIWHLDENGCWAKGPRSEK